MSFPSCSQRSSVLNPRTSRYQARLRVRSLTVKAGDTSLIFRESAFALTFAGAAFAVFEEPFLAVFFTAIAFLLFSFDSLLSGVRPVNLPGESRRSVPFGHCFLNGMSSFRRSSRRYRTRQVVHIAPPMYPVRRIAPRTAVAGIR